MQSTQQQAIEPNRITRHATRQARVSWGERVVTVGGDAPVRVQSMTNTDTADAIGTAIQVKELALAGSELVRITVNTPEAAQAVAPIREQLDRMGIDVPLIGDFHYNGHRLLTDYPDCAQALSKYRINPGNVGKGDKHDKQFGQMIEAAMRWDKPVRIGVNWGSLDQALLARPDGRQCRPGQTLGRQVGHVRSADPVRRGFGRPGVRHGDWSPIRSFCRARSAGCRT